MGPNRPIADPGEETGLVIQQAGEEHLVKYLTLVLSYLYGFNVLVARSVTEASSLLLERSQQIRCVFLVQDRELRSQTTLTALSLRGRLPVFLLVPEALVDATRALARDLPNTIVFASQHVAVPQGRSLREVIDEVFERHSIAGLFDGARHLSYRVLQQRVQRRLKHLNTLPTLPEVVLRIMETINDTESTAERLEEVLLSDAAVVHKLVQIVNAPTFAGSAQRGRWGLREAIVRLGRKKIGSLALQIKLINSLIKPEESGFDLRRFWIHSVGSAVIADRIVQDRAIAIDDWESCDEYWVAALLHDVGKLVLGFFFWSYFERLQQLVVDGGMTSRQAETRLGNVVTHEQVARLLLMRAGMSRDVVRAVGTHHEPEPLPPGLLCIVHLADNLAKELGMAYGPAERAEYSPSVLQTVDLDDARLEALRERLRSAVCAEVEELVGRCLD